MKVLITDDRNFTSVEAVYHELSQLPPGTIIIEGGARVADTIARLVGEELGFKVREHRADWGALRKGCWSDPKPSDA